MKTIKEMYNHCVDLRKSIKSVTDEIKDTEKKLLESFDKQYLRFTNYEYKKGMTKPSKCNDWHLMSDGSGGFVLWCYYTDYDQCGPATEEEFSFPINLDES